MMNRCTLLALLIWLCCCTSFKDDRPVLPPYSQLREKLKTKDTMCGGKLFIDSGADLIPHHLWIAVKDNASSYYTWPNIASEIRLNPTWSIHICDNADKDSFMSEFFNGTSLLWAYNAINPTIAGAAKADIWRYGVLYVIGGVYIDSDSELRKPLSQIIRSKDEFLGTFELNHFDGDWCYNPICEFATMNTYRAHPWARGVNYFKGRYVTNWCLMSAPRHLFFRAALESFTSLVKLEYIGLTGLKIMQWDPFMKFVYCTTGPSMFTASARKTLMERNCTQQGTGGGGGGGGHGHHKPRCGRKKTTSPVIPGHVSSVSGGGAGGTSTGESEDEEGQLLTGYRLASRDFIQEGGIFKAVRITKEDPNHYTQIKNEKNKPLPHLLHTYAPVEESKLAIMNFSHSPELEGQLIKGKSARSIFYLDKGVRRAVGGMDVMEAYNFTLAQVIHVSDLVVDTIPLGSSLVRPQGV